ncbi:dynein intermediate chain [Strigomonas culicis]|uniref:Dynein axonemal intermediate chain 4 n=1 Tax=Strigomonas culicis TaxID=28005 RepID=S9UJQ0_9TRYP|nr:dynein intermediate chain [Strigomonas culicis]|eukprot:EPY29138.1 dynein intermediate chain [Strigomonas culicis]
MNGSRSSFGDSSTHHRDSINGDKGAPAVSKKWIFAESLLSNLRVMERAVVQNFMERSQLAYRGIDMDAHCERVPRGRADSDAAARSRSRGDDDGTAEAEGAAAASAGGAAVPPVALSAESLQPLWCYRAPQTAGRRVTAMTWNRKEPDILAVGYSARGEKRDALAEARADPADKSERGLLCCWSLKNPLAPELVLSLHAETSVSALAFSSEHPSLLAVGCTDGSIVVYDIQRDLVAPSILPNVSTGVHTGAVWELRWVIRGKDRGEFLMSVAADGRVVQWAVGKSVERLAPDLMHLKRPTNERTETTFVEGVSESDEAAGRRREGAPREETILSQQSGGMCFDISPLDDAIYIVGTEEGCVYQCNKSQTETYDVAYEPHTELVYRVRWSPFHPYYFLTCSVDWTSRLYRVGRSAKVLTFDSLNQDAVQDVAWSYTNALLFATATAQGCVEVWSISDVVYPQAHIQFTDHRRLSCVLFAEQESAVLVVGDEEGDVTVFLLKDKRFERPEMDEDQQIQWFDDAVRNQTG